MYYKNKEWTQLIGRICVVAIFLTTVDLSLRAVLMLPLVICLLIGYKTQLAASLYIPLALYHAIAYYPFWMYLGKYSYALEVVKFEFFQQISSIGGFLQLVVYGGGELSLDARLKKE